MYELKYFEEAKKDYDNLDGSQVKQVDKALDKIKERGTEVGNRLSGNLSECFEIKQKRLGLRIIFQENTESISVINIIVIGKRTDKKVFNEASRRL